MSFFQTSKNLKLENEVGDLQKARAYWRHWSIEDGFTVHVDENKDKYIEIILEKDNFSGIKIESLQ